MAVAGLVLTFLSFSLSGCFQGNDGYDAYAQLEIDLDTIEEYLASNNIDAAYDSIFGLYYTIHSSTGNGYKIARSGTAQVVYQGYVLDGPMFATGGTAQLPAEYDFAIENPNGITVGFDIGLSNLRTGDSATFYVPSPYGYQEAGYGLNVGPNAILEYRVKFAGIKNLATELALIDQYIADRSFTDSIDTDYGIRYVVHSRGSGTQSPDMGDYISTHYTGQLLSGLVFDTSWDNMIPLDYRYSSDQVIVGFDLGFRHLVEGDSATFFVPSTYGYKDQPQGQIPANSVLVFGVKFLRLSPG
jgi:FKBP-type peptidyl-prolyl cis-trans isomerase